MQAMRLHEQAPIEAGPLQWEFVSDPKPGPVEVLVRVRACGVCRTDLHQVEGDLPMRRRPVIPGHQIVGEVVRRGAQATRFADGDRVAVAWLHQTCGVCAFCSKGRDCENLCDAAQFTGWTVDGGYAEYALVQEEFAYSIPASFDDVSAAPLLCAGIIGYRAFRLSGVCAGERLGLFGFGASAHLTIQIAQHVGCEVFVFTRSASNRQLARKLGATWVGGAEDAAPAQLDGSIIFAPAGRLVPMALEKARKGGTVALAGIHMSDVPPLDYGTHLYGEKVLRSVANATRSDGEQFLALAQQIPLKVWTTQFPLRQANEALLALKRGQLSGAAVLCAV